MLANAGVTWDTVPEVRANLTDISMPKVKAFIEAAKREKRRSIPAGTSPKELLDYPRVQGRVSGLIGTLTRVF